jgi:hypothetical protein
MFMIESMDAYIHDIKSIYNQNVFLSKMQCFLVINQHKNDMCHV